MRTASQFEITLTAILMALLVIKLTGLDHAQSFRDWVAVAATFLLSLVTVKALYSGLNFLLDKSQRERDTRGRGRD